MLIAHSKDGNRIRANPKEYAFCPVCKEQVNSKCGSIKIWHWAHKKESMCSYGEGMTKWHLQWQDWALNNGGDVEVDFGKHRADIVINKRIIELQHSNISEMDIITRSNFYVGIPGYRCDWVIDYTKNNFLSICESQIKADGRHKKVFDCLFGKHYGKVLFDIGENRIFNADWFHTLNVIVDENDFGTRYKRLYFYDGSIQQNIY
jgi:hypothetical protein